jgi:hypothetical protein
MRPQRTIDEGHCLFPKENTVVWFLQTTGIIDKNFPFAKGSAMLVCLWAGGRKGAVCGNQRIFRCLGIFGKRCPPSSR